MDTNREKLAVVGGAMLAVICLGACGSTTYQGSGSAATAAPAAPAATPRQVTPRQVTPKNGGGSPGQGPLVANGPASLPGSDPKVVLRDRTLVITSVTKHPGPTNGSVLIELNLMVRNTSGRSIENMPAFFRLIGPEGDSFNYRYNSSDNFYRPIGARAFRVGMTEFEIPAAAAASLSLLYRPEGSGETALIRLNVR